VIFLLSYVDGFYSSRALLTFFFLSNTQQSNVTQANGMGTAERAAGVVSPFTGSRRGTSGEQGDISSEGESGAPFLLVIRSAHRVSLLNGLLPSTTFRRTRSTSERCAVKLETPATDPIMALLTSIPSGDSEPGSVTIRRLEA
jgi:hypothetical protein